MYWIDILLRKPFAEGWYGSLICVCHLISRVQNGKRSGRKRKHGTSSCACIPIVAQNIYTTALSQTDFAFPLSSYCILLLYLVPMRIHISVCHTGQPSTAIGHQHHTSQQAYQNMLLSHR